MFVSRLPTLVIINGGGQGVFELEMYNLFFLGLLFNRECWDVNGSYT